VCVCAWFPVRAVHGCPRTQQLPVDAGSGRVRVAGAGHGVREGVRAVRVPPAGPAVWFLLPGKVSAVRSL